MDAREAVVEEVLHRIAEEQGVETLRLDWSILESILNKNNKDELNGKSYNDE